MKKSVLVITGPTGVGKSSLIYSLSTALPLSVISGDSRHMYNCMRIGTDYPKPSEIERFPHYLFSSISPDESYSAGRYIKEATQAIEAIIEQKRLPIILGGTFFYLSALLEGLPEEPIISQTLRDKISKLSKEESLSELQKVDALSASSINKNDTYRLHRALLISLASDVPFSRWQKSRIGGLKEKVNFIVYSLDRPRTNLYQRINARVESMFEAGLISEVEKLLSLNYTATSPGLQSIGYKQIINQLTFENNKCTSSQNEINQVKEIIARDTRHYAKRQLTWARNQKWLKIIDHSQSLYLITKQIKRN